MSIYVFAMRFLYVYRAIDIIIMRVSDDLCVNLQT